jgi:AcrR family transcriptional regulator
MERVSAAMAERLARAAGAFSEKGFESASIDDIAKATGIPRATLYYHFRSKDNVLGFLLESMLDETRVAVEAAIASRAKAPTRLLRVVEAHLTVMAGNPATARLLVGNLTGAGALTDMATAIQSTFRNPVSELLAEGIAEGSFRAVDIDRTVTALFGAVVVSGLHDLVVGDGIDVAAVSDAVMALVHDGLARPKGSEQITGSPA